MSHPALQRTFSAVHYRRARTRPRRPSNHSPCRYVFASLSPAASSSAIPRAQQQQQHAFARGERHQPAPRSHPHSSDAHTPPPHTTHVTGTSSAACCHPPRSAAPNGSSTQILPPRGWPTSHPATPGPSHPPYHLPTASAAVNRSGLRSPADEVVSAITASASSSPTGRPPHSHFSIALPTASASIHDFRHPPCHPYDPELSAYGDAPEHPYSARPAASTSARGNARYVDPPPDLNAPRGKVPAGGSSSPAEDSERRHCCPHCNKRFNRPSSLAIHVNTHTGAKRKSPSPQPSLHRCRNVPKLTCRHLPPPGSYPALALRILCCNMSTDLPFFSISLACRGIGAREQWKQ